jgi:hypothetical protein
MAYGKTQKPADASKLQWLVGGLLTKLSAELSGFRLTFCLGSETSSYSTTCPSLRLLRPARSTAEMWTNTSLLPPCSRPVVLKVKMEAPIVAQ